VEGMLRRCVPFTENMLLPAELMERPEIAVICARGGRLDEAREQIVRCRQITDNGEDWKGRAGWVDWAAGVVDAACGDAAAAAASFGRAADALGRHECVIEQAEVLYWWGLTLAEAGDRTASSERIDAAIAIYERIRAGRPFVERARAVRV